MLVIPEDSVLRRHYGSAIGLGHSVAGVPEDSMLRRHFLAALNAPIIRRGPAPEIIPKAVSSLRSTASPKAKSIENTTKNSGGLIAWLKRLFGS